MRMKTFLIPFILIACLFLTNCLNDDEPKDKIEEIKIEVSSETGITYHWGTTRKNIQSNVCSSNCQTTPTDGSP